MKCIIDRTTDLIIVVAQMRNMQDYVQTEKMQEKEKITGKDRF